MDKLRIYNVLWSSVNGGPSPDRNIRTELFLSGCKIASQGYPCDDCFNPDLWDANNYVAEEKPEKVLKTIQKFAPNKFITIVGGEPLDQFEPLSKLCKLLKENGYHIILFTHYLLINMVQSKSSEMYTLLNNVHVIIDGKYHKSKHLPQEDIDTPLNNSVGSGNQIVWSIEPDAGTAKGFLASSLLDIYVTQKYKLLYLYKDDAKKLVLRMWDK